MKRTKRLLSTLLALCMVLAMLPATALAAPDIHTDRYTVLVLDHSGSMSYNNALRDMKTAAEKFCQEVAKDTAFDNNTTNYVAVVGFSTTPDTVNQAPEAVFSSDIENVTIPAINRLEADGLTDISAALVEADRLLKAMPNDSPEAPVVKNIILLSDGLPENYHADATGRYSDSNHWAVPEANYCYRVVNENGLLNHYNVYSLGFFHALDAEDAAFCGRVLNDLQNKGFYSIVDATDLEFVFGDFIIEDIIEGGAVAEEPEEYNPNAARTIIKIACPVDVTVSIGDDSASSAGMSENTSIDIGKYGKMNILPGINGTTKEITVMQGYRYTIGMKATGDGEVKVTYTTFAADNTSTTTEMDPLIVKRGQNITVRVGRDGRVAVGKPTDETQTVHDVVSHFTFVPTVTGGTVVLSKRNAEPGDWVNIYVTPDEGYELESITVTDQRGRPVILREMGENAYSFTMPNARISVNPVFVKTEEPAGDYQYPINVPEINNSGAPGYGAMVINPGAMNYSDVSAGDWFYDNVKFAHERYLLTKTGEADGKFEPNTPATRASIWVAISRMAGRNTLNQGDNWYDRAQVWAKGKGITDGERPMGELTREEFVTMLWRYNGNKYVSNATLSQFNDGESVSWWATEAVKWAVASNLLKGDNGNLNPQNNVTRAEVAAVLQRYIQNVH